jgi:hypothetical protein
VGATWKCFEPGRYQEAFKANIEPMILEGTLNIGDIAEAISEVAGLFGKRMSKRAQLDDTINGLRNIRRTTFDLRGRRAISKQIWALQKHNKHEPYQELLRTQVQNRIAWGKKSEALGGWRDLPFLRNTEGILLDNNKGVTIFEKLYEKLYTEQEPLHFDVDIWAIANSPEFGRHDVEKVFEHHEIGIFSGLRSGHTRNAQVRRREHT